MDTLFLFCKSSVSSSILRLSLTNSAWNDPYLFSSQVSMMAATLPLNLLITHNARGGLFVRVLLQNGMCTTVSASALSDKLVVTFFGGGPLAQSINRLSPNDLSFLSVAEWPVSQPGWRLCMWHRIPLTRSDCWLTMPVTCPCLNLVVHWLPGGFIQTVSPTAYGLQTLLSGDCTTSIPFARTWYS